MLPQLAVSRPASTTDLSGLRSGATTVRRARSMPNLGVSRTELPAGGNITDGTMCSGECVTLYAGSKATTGKVKWPALVAQAEGRSTSLTEILSSSGQGQERGSLASPDSSVPVNLLIGGDGVFMGLDSAPMCEVDAAPVRRLLIPGQQVGFANPNYNPLGRRPSFLAKPEYN